MGNEVAEVGETPIDPGLRGRQLIGELITRMRTNGSHELIPADDPVALQLVKDALDAIVEQDKSR